MISPRVISFALLSQRARAGTPTGGPIVYDTILGNETLELVDASGNAAPVSGDNDDNEIARNRDGVSIHPTSTVHLRQVILCVVVGGCVEYVLVRRKCPSLSRTPSSCARPSARG
jgi:hypothetical protein